MRGLEGDRFLKRIAGNKRRRRMVPKYKNPEQKPEPDIITGGPDLYKTGKPTDQETPTGEDTGETEKDH